jgi:hypothetical protein
MAVYIITGTLGSGKTLAMVNRIKEYILQGRKVAANIDLNQDVLVPDSVKNPEIYRLPDRPLVDDLINLGIGCEEYNEEKFGGIFLDEAALWLNTRNFQDKDRKDIINHLVNIRKRRWDVYITIQHVNALDKQIREMFGEHVVVCQRLDRLPIPFFGTLMELFGFTGKFGKFHVCKVRYGLSPNSPKVDTWYFTGRSLYDAYNTMQEYSPEQCNERVHAPLPKSYWEGRPSEWQIFKKRAKRVLDSFQYKARWFFLSGLAAGVMITGKADNHKSQSAVDDKKMEVKKLTSNDYTRISGSFVFDNRALLFFEKNGSPWEPKNEGYRVLVKHGCHAVLLKSGEKKDVYCGEAVTAPAGAESPQETSSKQDGGNAIANLTGAVVDSTLNTASQEQHQRNVESLPD